MRDEFDEPELRPIWSFARDPDDADWSLQTRPGWLQLMGSASTLSDEGSVAFVGRRQQHFIFTVRAVLDFEPSRDGEEAGLVARMNERHHYEIGVACVAGQRRVLVRLRVGDIERVDTVAVPDTGGLVLQVAADETRYRFSWSSPGGAPVEISSAETRYLSSEVAGGFTGVFLGMYATGSGHRSSTPASWDWFEYDPGSS
jgi:alpha-N-arabinofuranosidase